MALRRPLIRCWQIKSHQWNIHEMEATEYYSVLLSMETDKMLMVCMVVVLTDHTERGDKNHD